MVYDLKDASFVAFSLPSLSRVRHMSGVRCAVRTRFRCITFNQYIQQDSLFFAFYTSPCLGQSLLFYTLPNNRLLTTLHTQTVTGKGSACAPEEPKPYILRLKTKNIPKLLKRKNQ